MALRKIVTRQTLTIAGLILFFILFWFSPHSKEISDQAWQLLTIFLATIFAIIFKVLPIGAIALIALTLTILTNTLSLEEALSGFQNSIAWLVVFAFFIARGFIKTGLGNRVAYYFVALFGERTLGLSYGLLASEFILSPAIPSVTARTGGIIFPIVYGLSETFGSDPHRGTERKIGSFLMKVAYQGSTITSAMFLTAMAANPLLAALTQEAGYSISWSKWALAALIPGLLSLIVMPWLVFKLYPPALKYAEDAPYYAKTKLKEMGRLKKHEVSMLAIFVVLLLLWIFGSFFNISATTAAMIGVSLLVIFNVLHWTDVIKESAAWDTFIWFSTLIMLATGLNRLGFTPWLSQQVVALVGGLGWMLAFLSLALIYFYSHYFFASNTAHVSAMYPAFLLVAIGVGTPPELAILVFAFLSSLMGGLTHYGSGPAPIFYGAGYIDVRDWWRVGFLLSMVNLVIWLGIGGLWWKLLGFW